MEQKSFKKFFKIENGKILQKIAIEYVLIEVAMQRNIVARSHCSTMYSTR